MTETPHFTNWWLEMYVVTSHLIGKHTHALTHILRVIVSSVFSSVEAVGHFSHSLPRGVLVFVNCLLMSLVLYIHIQGRLFYPPVGMTSPTFQTVICGRLRRCQACVLSLGGPPHQRDADIPGQRGWEELQPPAGSVAAPWGRQEQAWKGLEAARGWAQHFSLHRAPANMINLSPSCKSGADFLFDIPGAQLPSGFELLLQMEKSPARRGAGGTLWGSAVFLSDNCCRDVKATALVFCSGELERNTASNN